MTTVRWLLFDVYESMIIESVDVFANGAGPREIGVIDADGEVIASTVIELSEGVNTIPLGFEVEPGVNYGLRSFDDNPQLWRDGPGTVMTYPYALGEMGLSQKAQQEETMQPITIISFTIGS